MKIEKLINSLKLRKLKIENLVHSLKIAFGSESLLARRDNWSLKIKRNRRKLLPFAIGTLLILLPVLIYSIYHSDPVRADSLLSLDEGYGSTANDASGNVSGSITGATWKTEDLCVKATCLFFDGAGDYIDLGDDADLDFAQTDDFTISLWFRHPQMTGTAYTLVGKVNASAGYMIYMESDGDIVFGIEDDSTWNPDASVTSTAATYDDNRWHYLSVVKDGATGIYLYIDAQLIDSDEAISGIGSLVNSVNFYVGIASDGASYPYQGFIDELKVYRSARTADEIKADFLETSVERGTAAKFAPNQKLLSDGLVGYWNMENSWTDRSGSSNGLLNVGVATASAKFNYGAEFVSGNSEFLYNSSPKFDNARTISFWANPDATTNYFFTLDNASVQASSGTISTTGLSNPKIFVNGEESTTLTADAWQHVTVTTDSLNNPTNTGNHSPFPNNNQAPGRSSDIFCLTEDDCKMAFVNTTDTSLRFMDCDDASCTSGTVSVLDGGTGCTLTGGDVCDTSANISWNVETQSLSLYCPTANDCKISYYDSTPNSALMFADCDDEYCASGSVSILDGLTGCKLTDVSGDVCDPSISAGAWSSIYCPTADDCKIAYYDSTNTALMFAACANSTCSSGRVAILDGMVGCHLTDTSNGDECDTSIAAGTYLSLTCPAANNCKVSYYDATNTALMFADCADEYCSSSSGTVQVLDGYSDGSECALDDVSGDICDTGIDAGRYETSIACPSSDHCVVSYYDATNTALMFGYCDDEYCSSGRTEIVDGLTGCGLIDGDACGTGTSAGRYSSLYCPAAANCKISYVTDGALTLADCGDAYCSSGSVEDLTSATPCSLQGGDSCNNDTSLEIVNTSLYCPTSDNCKLSYYDYTYTALMFSDCSTESCSAGSVETVDGYDNEISWYFDMYCVTADDCKMIYYNDTDTSLRFVDCDDATCTSGPMSILDGAPGCVLTGGDGCITSDNNDMDASIYCPTANDCKISYYSASRSALMFADCDNAACTSGSTEILDGYSGCSLTGCDTGSDSIGRFSWLYCPSATDCKIAYLNTTDDDLKFADCTNATCSSGSTVILDGDASCTLTSDDGCGSSTEVSRVSLYCPTTDNCKVAYYDSATATTALKFGACGNAACSSGSVEIVDGITGCNSYSGDGCSTGIDAGDSPAIYCPTATDCKASYYDGTNKDLRFVDCDDATCATGSIEVVDGNTTYCGLTGCANIEAGYDSSLYCPTATDCKIAYSDRGGNADLKFADCDDATCSTGTVDMLDGGASCSLTGGVGCNTNNDSGGYDLSMSCPAANNCKILYMYRDHQEDALMFGDCDDATCSSGSVGIADNGLPTTLAIGKVGTNYYDGTLDEIRVYNRTFSPAEVRTLYNWAPGPVGYWKMDENTGTTTYDSSGNGNIGTMTNSGWVSGKFGSGIKTTIDNALDNTTIGDPSSGIFDFSDTESYTLEAWVKSSSLDGNMRVISKGGGGISDIGYDLFLDSAGNKYPCRYTDGDGSGIDAVDIMLVGIAEDNQWHYIACVMDRNGTYTGTPGLYGYLDGVLNDSNTSLTESSAKDNSSSLIIGEKNTNSEANAIIDDVKIYNYARSQQQIVSDMMASHPSVALAKEDAIGHWDFDEGYGDTAHNSGSGGSTLNGNLGGSSHTCPLAGTEPCPAWSNNGKFGKALSFDSADDYVNLGSTSFTSFTWSSWINHNASGDYYLVDSSDIFMRTGVNCSSNKIDIGIYTDSGWQEYCSTSTFTNGTWYQIALLFDSATATTSLYVNGKLDNSRSIAGTFSHTTALYVSSSGHADQAWNGLIDEVKIYNFALTADQIKLLYNQSSSAVMGALSTESSSGTGDQNSALQSYCIPGDTATCSSPVGEWKFDENTGQTAYDTSGNNNNSTLGGTSSPQSTDPKWTPGKKGSALEFDGSDDYSSRTSPTFLNGKSAFTLSTWVKPGFAYNAASRPERWVYNTGNYGPNLKFADYNSKYYIGCQFWDTAVNGNEVNTAFQNTPSWEANTWHHLTCVYDGSNFNLYWDGQLVKAGTGSGTVHDSNGSLYFSRDSYPWLGSLDDFNIYDYARTPAQIAWDYNHGKPVGWWMFDECSDTVAYDSGSGNNNGTIYPQSLDQTSVGSCSANANTMWYNGRTGKYSSSLNFDGSDDYVSLGNPDELNFTKNFTLSAWVKPIDSFSRTIISKVTDTNDKQYQIWLNASGNGGVRFEYERSANDYYFDTPNGSVPNSKWSHIVVTVDSSLNIIVYVNGIVKASGTAPAEVITSSDDVSIGHRLGTYNDTYFYGQIDDVKIFNYALTAEQIKTLFNYGAVSFGP